MADIAPSAALTHSTGRSILNGVSEAAPRLITTLNLDVLALVADAVICTDEDGRILVFNQAAERAFDYSASEVIGQPVEMLLPESYRAEHIRQVRNFGQGDGAANRLMGSRREIRGRRRNGDEFPAEAMVSRQTIDGRTILTVVQRDITERKAFEELREAVARETDHRMRNVLSVVNSLISLSAAHAENVEEFKDSLLGRLNALAVAQTVLHFGGQKSASLPEIFLAELAQYQTPGGVNISMDVPPVWVGARAAQILTLAIHELATNSAKYGALHEPGGRIAVSSAYKGEENNQLVIEWQETGGPPVKPPTRKGFGTDLIQKLLGRTLQADVTLDYHPEGLVCRMTLPKTIIEAER